MGPASATDPAPRAGGWTSTLRPDLVAGLTATAVVVPKAMALATVAGVPVEVGLYTCLLPLPIYAALGTSRVLNVASFISAPVLTGFKAGTGLVILLDQTPEMLGIHHDKMGWFGAAASLVRHLPETSALTLALALVVLLGMERSWPRSPAALIAGHGPTVVALDFSGVPDLEYSALKMLMEADRRAAVEGLAWWLVGLNPRVLDVVRRSGLADTLGRERMLFNARAAIERYQARGSAGRAREREEEERRKSEKRARATAH